MEVLKLCIRYRPATLAVYYRDVNSNVNRIHEILLEGYFSNDSGSMESMVKKLVQMNGYYLNNQLVSESQLVGLLTKIKEDKEKPKVLEINLNRVSTSVLDSHKQKMNSSYLNNVVQPNDPNYEYDKRKDFKPILSNNEWDE